MEYVLVFFTTLLQNASFTLVSRARNSKSLWYHGIASVLSNGLWLLTMSKMVSNFNNTNMMLTYLAASTVGAVLMHWITMRFIENKIKA